MPKNEQRSIENIDALLGAEAQQDVRSVVAGLSEDMPSMAWRAQLNERLLQMAPPVRRSPWVAVWRPALGLGLAGVLAVTLVNPRPTTIRTESASLEASLVQLHEQSSWGIDFGSEEVSPAPAGNTWTESDIDLL